MCIRDSNECAFCAWPTWCQLAADCFRRRAKYLHIENSIWSASAFTRSPNHHRLFKDFRENGAGRISAQSRHPAVVPNAAVAARIADIRRRRETRSCSNSHFAGRSCRSPLVCPWLLPAQSGGCRSGQIIHAGAHRKHSWQSYPAKQQISV